MKNKLNGPWGNTILKRQKQQGAEFVRLPDGATKCIRCGYLFCYLEQEEDHLCSIAAYDSRDTYWEEKEDLEAEEWRDGISSEEV